jgi:hypothetical protein
MNLCLNLDLIPKISPYILSANSLKLEEIQNLKHIWFQAFQIGDTHAVYYQTLTVLQREKPGCCERTIQRLTFRWEFSEGL